MIADLEEAPKIGFQLRDMALRRVEVERLGNLPDGPEEGLTIRFQLGLDRPSDDELGVELILRVSHNDILQAEISYRGLFVYTGSDDHPPTDSVLRSFAARVAPSILYPFIRETLASLVVKTGLPALVLPVLNFEGVFDQEAVVIPTVGGTGGEANGAAK